MSSNFLVCLLNPTVFMDEYVDRYAIYVVSDGPIFSRVTT